MRRSTKKRSPELRELQEAFKLHVLFAGDPDGRPLRCWFQEVDERPCEGPPRAGHYIKRQRVRNALYALGLDPDLIALAEWDPRLGVPSCAAHDDRHDGHQMPPLVVAADKVPLDVAHFALDWGLEFELERRSPLSDECRTGVRTTGFLNTLDVARSERVLLDG